MKVIARALYNQPVVFLAILQALTTYAAAAKVFTPWIPAVTLVVVTALQRELVRPDKPRRR
jgi:hypothetical protein